MISGNCFFSQFPGTLRSSPNLQFPSCMYSILRLTILSPKTEGLEPSLVFYFALPCPSGGWGIATPAQPEPKGNRVSRIMVW